MNIRLLILSALLAPLSLFANNIIFVAGYMPEDTYAFKSKGGKNADYLIGGLNIRGVGGNEIDGHEALTVKFDAPVVMQNIQIGLLFSGDVAVLSAGADTYELQAYGFNQAHYLKNGVLVAELIEDENDWGTGLNAYGMWTLHDPFGSDVITKFTLSAGEGSFGLMSFNTLDSALMPVAANDVPDGAPTLGLLTFGTFGLIALTKRLT